MSYNLKTETMNTERLTKAFADNQPKTPMTPEETRIFMNLMLTDDPNISMDVNELDKKTDFYKHFKPLVESFVAKVFLGRLKSLTTHRITVGALIILMQYMKSPGNCVMYVYYINSKLAPNTLIDINVIAMDLFPWGMFSDEQLNDIWDAQKVRSTDGLDEWNCHGSHDNLLDYNETWGK